MMRNVDAGTRDEIFTRHRPLVFHVAYDITGTIAEAEDVCQDTYLRWRSAPVEPANPRAYLAKTAANVALNSVRSAVRRREDYIGPWLPDPLPTAAETRPESDPERAAITAEAVSAAMLVVLQSLGERERAAFILHEVFDVGYDDIADALATTAAASRQLVSRARAHVRDKRALNDVSAAHHRDVVSRFAAAAQSGDVDALIRMLAPGAVVTTDSGGLVSAARRPVVGAEHVARFIIGLALKYTTATMEPVELNGRAAVGVRTDGELVATFQCVVDGDRVDEIYIMRNPERLAVIDAYLVG